VCLGERPPVSGLPSSVLFACSENALRSPMAEALAKRLYGRSMFLDSAGVRAGETVDEFAATALSELGIDLRAHRAKSLEDIDPSSFDLIVTLSPEAHHNVLEFTRSAAVEVEYWPMPDPSAVEGGREVRLDAYRQSRDFLMVRLMARFGAPSGPQP
jgi:protein-tyrosine-phosphatase